MAEKNRSSQLAVVTESTPGTPVAPSAGGQFLALQEGFSFEPNFQQLENAEIKASIGVAKSIQGLEEPQGSFDHYLRHSGVEGQAPNFLPLLSSALGASSTNSTERLTTTASTVAQVKLASGGTDIARGKAVLVKDGANGYNIRPVHSVTGNNLNLGFDLLQAPASGVGVGKCVNASVADTGHTPLSMWLYRGNGGAIEMISGSYITDLDIKVKAGELIDASYSFEGVKYFFDPLQVTASDVYIDFTDDAGSFSGVVPQGFYRSPADLAAAIQLAMNTASPTITHTVNYVNASGKFQFLASGTLLSLPFASGSHAANTVGDKIGFLTDQSGSPAGTGYLSPSAVSWSNGITPSYDVADPLAAKNNEVLIGDETSTACFCAESIDISLKNDLVNEECVCAVSGVADKIHSKRTVEAKIVGFLTRGDADLFNRFATNADCRFAFNYGIKAGTNWVPGKCGNIYIPTATVSAYKLGDSNGIVTMEITVKAYVDSSGNGEFYMNFL